MGCNSICRKIWDDDPVDFRYAGYITSFSYYILQFMMSMTILPIFYKNQERDGPVTNFEFEKRSILEAGSSK